MAVQWTQNPLPVWRIMTGKDVENEPYNLRQYVNNYRIHINEQNELRRSDLHFEIPFLELGGTTAIVDYLYFVSSGDAVDDFGKTRFPDCLAVPTDIRPVDLMQTSVLPIGVYDIGFGERPTDSFARTNLPILVWNPLRIEPPSRTSIDSNNNMIRVTASGGPGIAGQFSWYLRGNVPSGVEIADVQENVCLIQVQRSAFSANVRQFVLTVVVATADIPESGYEREEVGIAFPVNLT